MKTETPKIRLSARDDDDIAVFSTLLQDAIIPGADMTFKKESKEFVIVANRFCWELEPSTDLKSNTGKPLHERRLCGIRISHINSVRQYQWPKSRQDTLFNLLALRCLNMAKKARGGYALQLEFSGGSSLRLNVDAIDVLLIDLDQGYPTSLQPSHQT